MSLTHEIDILVVSIEAIKLNLLIIHHFSIFASIAICIPILKVKH